MRQLPQNWTRTVSVLLGEEDDDFEDRKQTVLKQEWQHKRKTEPMKRAFLERACAQKIAGPPDVVVERLSRFRDFVDVVSVFFPLVGDLRRNGLDTIGILKERVLPRL